MKKKRFQEGKKKSTPFSFFLFVLHVLPPPPPFLPLPQSEKKALFLKWNLIHPNPLQKWHSYFF